MPLTCVCTDGCYIGYELLRGKFLPCRRENCLLRGWCINTSYYERDIYTWIGAHSSKQFIFFLPRNGPEFEARIRQNEINNPKFNFLNPNDPYHAYYRHKVSEFKEGKAQEPSAAIPKVMQQQQSAQQQLPQKASIPFCFGQEVGFQLAVSHPNVKQEVWKTRQMMELVTHLQKRQHWEAWSLVSGTWFWCRCASSSCW